MRRLLALLLLALLFVPLALPDSIPFVKARFN